MLPLLFHTAVFGMGLPVVSAQYGYEMPISRKNPPNPLNTTFQCADGEWLQIAFFQYDNGSQAFVTSSSKSRNIKAVNTLH